MVLPASCFSRRTCVRCPLDNRFVFFFLIVLSIKAVTPFLDNDSNPRGCSADMQLYHLAEMEAHDG